MRAPYSILFLRHLQTSHTPYPRDSFSVTARCTTYTIYWYLQTNYTPCPRNGFNHQKEPSNSWELLDHQTSQADADKLDDLDEEQDEVAEIDTRTRDAAKTATDSLRDIADRIGKGVEIFPETLDRFFDNLPTA
jgi:hypothetical protein